MAPPPTDAPTHPPNLGPEAPPEGSTEPEPSDESISRLQLIVDSVPGLMSYLDRDGRYLLVNRAYRAWFGEATSFVGRTVADVERDLILDTLDHVLGNRTSDRYRGLPAGTPISGTLAISSAAVVMSAVASCSIRHPGRVTDRCGSTSFS